MNGLNLSNQNEIVLTARERRVRDLYGGLVKGACYPVGKTVSTKMNFGAIIGKIKLFHIYALRG